jgi:hypothetical protein
MGVQAKLYIIFFSFRGKGAPQKKHKASENHIMYFFINDFIFVNLMFSLFFFFWFILSDLKSYRCVKLSSMLPRLALKAKEQPKKKRKNYEENEYVDA